MRFHLPILFAAGALCGADAVVAAPVTDADIARTAKRTEARQHFFERLDANHDGTISRAEYQAWVDRRFDRLDANRDGVVDANEVANSPAKAERARKRAERFVERYDASGSGKVSKTDFEARQMAHFDRLGGGADSLTVEQFAAARQHGRHGTNGASDQ